MPPASRTGLTSGAAVTVRGIKEFRRELRRLHGEWPRALRDVHKEIADHGAKLAQGYARGMGGVQAKAAAAIKGYANQREARIGVSAGKTYPMANVAFWGAKRHTGWYAGIAGPAQHPPWVGNSWDVAVVGEGPYAINPALAAYLPELMEMVGDRLEQLARAAFPD